MSVSRNFVYNVAYQILLLALPLVTAPYVSRMLGAASLELQKEYGMVNIENCMINVLRKIKRLVIHAQRRAMMHFNSTDTNIRAIVANSVGNHAA